MDERCMLWQTKNREAYKVKDSMTNENNINTENEFLNRYSILIDDIKYIKSRQWAITYYLSHTDGVKEYLKRQGALWEKWRKESMSRPNPVVERLRASRATDVSQDS